MRRGNPTCEIFLKKYNLKFSEIVALTIKFSNFIKNSKLSRYKLQYKIHALNFAKLLLIVYLRYVRNVNTISFRYFSRFRMCVDLTVSQHFLLYIYIYKDLMNRCFWRNKLTLVEIICLLKRHLIWIVFLYSLHNLYLSIVCFTL